ncbi:uncharacterized protein F5891DRAFT_1208780 [Suillus fuscotomentosus]|uniref:Uncharacterized protein n=1 Tax=Suillus fuscotomentosus TaxID=1912939 RepID=A0AAD4ED38_9AGAM|nr:uncharacterized protein F5891DRAFT_1208780 [Suillus fuscotomentosus]KAG1903937.1 hypothetical protein F5891DRAFT_1208780 [Suillus fuscotomentosus]
MGMPMIPSYHLAKVLLPLPNLHTPTSNRSERNLINAPHLLSFFLNFVLRNSILPEVSHEHDIRNALDIVELAKKELPLVLPWRNLVNAPHLLSFF